VYGLPSQGEFDTRTGPVTVALGAEPASKVYRIGVLTETRIEIAQQYWQTALRERGYIEGQNAAFEFRAETA
jgi:hypothetical protein